MELDNFRDKIRQIYDIATELENMFPGRKFTPDGHMVGSIGEAIATIDYGVKLHKTHVHPGTDGIVNDRKVQVKATQGEGVAIKMQEPDELLLVLKIKKDGTWEKIYDGDSERVWIALKGQRENRMGEKTISLKRLQGLQAEVKEKDRISLCSKSS